MTVRAGEPLDNVHILKKPREDKACLLSLKGIELWSVIALIPKQDLKRKSSDELRHVLITLTDLATWTSNLPSVEKVARKVTLACRTVFHSEVVYLMATLQAQPTNFSDKSKMKLSELAEKLFLKGDKLFRYFVKMSDFASLAHLYIAIEDQNNKKVLKILECGIDPSLSHPEELNLLSLACRLLKKDAILALIEKNAVIGKECVHNVILNPRLKNEDRLTILKALEAKDASFVERDYNLNLPLHLAVKHARNNLIPLLIPYSIKENQYNFLVDTPYSLAIQKNNLQAFELLHPLPELREVSLSLADSPEELALQSKSIDIATILKSKSKTLQSPQKIPALSFRAASDQELLAAHAILNSPASPDIFSSSLQKFVYDHAKNQARSMATRVLNQYKTPLYFELRAKRISHVWGIKASFVNPLTKNSFSSFFFGEVYSHLFWQQIIEDLADLGLSSSFVLEAFRNCFIRTGFDSEAEIRMAYSAIQNERFQKPFVVVSGSDLHVSYVIFYENIVIFCDRSSTTPGLNIYGLPTFDSITEEMFDDLTALNQDHADYFDQKQFVIETGAYPIAQSRMAVQKNNNCSHASAGAALYGLQAIEEVIKSGKSLYEENSWTDLEKAQENYKLASSFYRLQELLEVIKEVESYLESGNKTAQFDTYYYKILLGLSLKLNENVEKLSVLKKFFSTLEIDESRLIQHLSYLMERLI